MLRKSMMPRTKLLMLRTKLLLIWIFREFKEQLRLQGVFINREPEHSRCMSHPTPGTRHPTPDTWPDMSESGLIPQKF